MALNWNSFLTDEGLNANNDRWPASKPTPERNAPATAAPSNQSASDLISPFEGSNAETYFSDAFYNGPGDYFLSDLEVLEPLGNVTLAGGSTSDSSPEAYNDFTNDPTVQFKTESRASAAPSMSTLDTASPGGHNAQRQRVPPPSTASLKEIQQNYVTAFPDQRQPYGMDNGLSYPTASSRSTRNSLSALDTLAEVPETDLTTKRSKGSGGRTDAISACWESPLCPNHDRDGSKHPNPSSCGGGCAPFLFGDGDPLADANLDSQLLAQNPVESRESPQGVVEIPRRLKRSESESTGEPSGRVFSTNTSKHPSASATAEPQPRMKNESSPDSPPDEAAAAVDDDAKGKTRRRLPHNQVERKYRESLNTQLDSLRRVVPALQAGARGGCGEGGDIEDLPTPSKPSKAVVLASATAYIKQMEKDRRQLADENALLRARIKALQALVKCEDCSLMQYVMDLKIHNPA